MIKNKYVNLFWMMRNERRSRDELSELQNAKLRRLCKHAYNNVVFYRNLFEKSGCNPGDIKSVDDIHNIPIIDKKDIQHRPYSELVDRRIRATDTLIPIHTSGSSGIPLRFYIDRSYEQYRKAQYMRPYLANGRRLTDRAARLVYVEEPKEKWFQRLGVMKEYSVYSNSDVDSQVRMIKDIKPTIIQGHGSCLHLLGSKILDENISIDAPRIIFTDSEVLTEQFRMTIELAFRTEVIDIYGTYETENIAYECREHKGYHVTSDSVILELLRDGKRVEPGEEGEIVCTVLDNSTMPFIRYNLHDIATYTDQPCSCGRTFPLLKMICGRSDDYAIDSSGMKRSPGTFLGHFIPLAHCMREFQVIQEEINSFTVLLVPSLQFNVKTEQTIKEAIWKAFPGTQVTITLVDKIDREKSGKFRAFVSNVTKQVK